eukprot:jgi/Mesvir1/21803/Mv04194-RA.1
MDQQDDSLGEILSGDSTAEQLQTAHDKLISKIERILKDNDVLGRTPGDSFDQAIDQSAAEECMAEIQTTMETGIDRQGRAEAIVLQLQQFDIVEQQQLRIKALKAEREQIDARLKAEESFLNQVSPEIPSDDAYARTNALSMQLKQVEVFEERDRQMAELKAKHSLEVDAAMNHLREQRRTLMESLRSLLPDTNAVLPRSQDNSMLGGDLGGGVHEGAVESHASNVPAGHADKATDTASRGPPARLPKAKPEAPGSGAQRPPRKEGEGKSLKVKLLWLVVSFAGGLILTQGRRKGYWYGEKEPVEDKSPKKSTITRAPENKPPKTKSSGVPKSYVKRAYSR